jgi:dihydroceramidase
VTPSDAFWGAPTASIDWCESNYVYSKYICEFFNTLSSLAMVIAGIVGFAWHRRILEARFMLAFVALSIVGLGSIAFHATLRFELQMLDELPMLYLALVMVFILLEIEPKPRFGRWFPVALALHGVLVTALCAGTRGQLQFYAFHSSFGSLEVFCLVRAFLLFRRAHSSAARRLFLAGVSSYLIAIAIWFTDLRFCHFVSVTLPAFGIPNPELHAFWHILVSLGFYLLILFIGYERLTRLGLDPSVAMQMGWVPRLMTSGS